MFALALPPPPLQVQRSPARLGSLFREDSLAGILLSGGNEEAWGFSLLHSPGLPRDTFSLILRRAYSRIFDGGVVCSDRHPAALRTLLGRAAAPALLALPALLATRARL